MARMDVDKSNTITFEELVFGVDEDTMAFRGISLSSIKMPELPIDIPIKMPRGLPGVSTLEHRAEDLLNMEPEQ